jgi:beta-phosphoglucomutase-like phosphatase (HAD superfamily)|tara:strand:+ start:336 stop:488 length:153 start_codon:yes stop_codon:yes gene_type:complete
MADIKVVIFDADGVLIDSAIPSMESYQKITADLGIAVPMLEFMKKHWGLT